MNEDKGKGRSSPTKNDPAFLEIPYALAPTLVVLLEKCGPGCVGSWKTRPAERRSPGVRSCDKVRDDLPPTSVAALRAIGNYALIRMVHLSEKRLRRDCNISATIGADTTLCARP